MVSRKNIISILCPSRGRPERLDKYLNSLKKTATCISNYEVLLRLDNDDSTLEDYYQVVSNYENVEIQVGASQPVGILWNLLARSANGNLLMMGNDDVIQTSEDWDFIFLQESFKYEDEIFCLYGRDSFQKRRGTNYCTFPVVGRRWYKTLGYFTPEIFMFGYNDTWIAELGNKINRLIHVSSVEFDHHHFSYFPEYLDDTYQRNRNSMQFHKDKKTFQENQQTLNNHALKLRKAIETYRSAV